MTVVAMEGGGEMDVGAVDGGGGDMDVSVGD